MPNLLPTGMMLAIILAPQFLRSSLGILDARQPISVYIEDGKSVPGYRDSDRELAKMALAAWSRESGGKLKFTQSTEREGALIRLHWISPADGLYGETQRIEVNGKPGAIVRSMALVKGEEYKSSKPYSGHKYQCFIQPIRTSPFYDTSKGTTSSCI